MSGSMWDVPKTREGMRTLLENLDKCQAAGDMREVAFGLLQLSWLAKWVPMEGVASPFFESRKYAEQALEIFRRLDDRKGIVKALIGSAPMSGRTAEKLAEAEAIARELDDELVTASVLAARGRSGGGIENTQRALEIYRRHGSLGGQAQCLFGLSISLGTNAEKRAYALEAAGLYGALGDDMRFKCISIASWNNDTPEDWIEMEPLFKEQLAAIAADGNRQQEKFAYRNLAKVYRAKGEIEQAETYERWDRELEEASKLSPRQRKKEQIDSLKWMIGLAQMNGSTEYAAELKAQLKKVRNTKPE